MKHYVTLMSLIIASTAPFLGCNDRRETPKESFDETRDRLLNEIEAEYANRVSAVSEEARKNLPAESVDSLIESFTLAFNAGDTDALTQMTYLENATKEVEDILINGAVSIRSAGTSTIQELTVRDLTETEFKDYWTLHPVKIIAFTCRENDDSGGSSRETPVVEVEGRFYFYACGFPQH